MTDANPDNEPSMEEILASIRRIISDGEEGEGQGEGEAAEPMAEAPGEVFASLPSGEPEPEPEEDILDLTQMVTEQGEVVDLNEAKSARGLGPANAGPVEPAAAAADDAELTMEGLARALDDVIGETSPEGRGPEGRGPEGRGAEGREAEGHGDDVVALEPWVEAVQPEEVVLAGSEDAEPLEPLSPLDALAEIEALANQQAEAAEEPLELGTPGVLQAFEPAAPEPGAAEPQTFEEVFEEAAAPVEASATEEPLQLVDRFGAEEAQDSADDALTEIDQILARAREAAQAQAAKILEEEPEAAPLSPEDETAALLAGLEPQEENPLSSGPGVPEDIRSAVEESLGGGTRESNVRGPGQDPFRAVAQAAEANAPGVAAQADSVGEEQNLADRKDSSYRSRGEEAEPGLISSNTAAGAIAALGDLSRAARQNSGGQANSATALGMNRTLEELVLDAMTPHLKAWLDTNLEPLVERVVREEIQRLRRRSEDY